MLNSIDSRTGANLWARRFEGDLGRGFQLQDRLTESVVGEVVTKLEQAEIDLHRRSQSLFVGRLFAGHARHKHSLRVDSGIH